MLATGGSSRGWPCSADEGQSQYPKLQLVHIDNAWYALNQSCLQIYQMLQQSGRAQLMPVDIVPLHKVSTIVSLTIIRSLSALDHFQNMPCNYFTL